MRHRTVFLRWAAFLLILVFSQKSGAGLFLHNFLHTGSFAKEAPDNNDTRTVNYGCTCVDDFLTPIEGTVVLSFDNPRPVILINSSFVKDITPFAILALPALRGPPAA
ncbi:MAG: hypothetical protein HZB42_01065 [Sphingobacteriales bacterium]|nr:hypothetical protein [Sphingobacteriales bacterium]